MANIYISPLSRPLKIAVFVWDFVTTGGAERYACEVTKRLAEHHDVHVFCQSWDSEISNKITFHKIPRPIKKPSWINQLFFSFFTKLAVDDSFDIIHTHDRVSRFDILTIHCPCYKGFITEKETLLRKIITWISVIISPRSLAYLWIEKKQFTYTRKKKLISVSKSVQEDVIRNYFLPEKIFSLAYPGVDVESIKKNIAKADITFLRKKLNLKEDNLVLLFVGTEFKRKGLDNLLDAVARCSYPDIRLLVAGGGDSCIYERKIMKKGIAGQVTFLGLVKDIFPYYGIADIFILPTLSDPCPMSPVEAMASGVATIMSVTPYCGTAEHITQGEAILLNDPRDTEELSEAIMRLADPEIRKVISEKGRKLATSISWEQTTKKTFDAYCSLLEQRDM